MRERAIPSLERRWPQATGGTFVFNKCTKTGQRLAGRGPRWLAGGLNVAAVSEQRVCSPITPLQTLPVASQSACYPTAPCLAQASQIQPSTVLLVTVRTNGPFTGHRGSQIAAGRGGCSSKDDDCTNNNIILLSVSAQAILHSRAAPISYSTATGHRRWERVDSLVHPLSSPHSTTVHGG